MNKINFLCKVLLCFLITALLNRCSDTTNVSNLDSIIGTWEIEKIEGDDEKELESLLNAYLTFFENGEIRVHAIHKSSNGNDSYTHHDTLNYRIDANKLFMSTTDKKEQATFKLKNDQLMIYDPVNNATIFLRRIDRK